MTPSQESSELPNLDLLGRRLDVAIRRRRAPARRTSRTLALAAIGVTMLVAAPAVASITGVFGDGGETIEEAFPSVIDRAHPVATGRALERRGYSVSWILIEDNPDRDHAGAPPTIWRKVAAPPPDTEILSLLDTRGQDTATPSSRSLLIEIAPSRSEILRSHDR